MIHLVVYKVSMNSSMLSFKFNCCCHDTELIINNYKDGSNDLDNPDIEEEDTFVIKKMS